MSTVVKKCTGVRVEPFENIFAQMGVNGGYSKYSGKKQVFDWRAV